MPDIRRLDSETGPKVKVLSIERHGYVCVQTLGKGLKFETRLERLYPK